MVVTRPIVRGEDGVARDGVTAAMAAIILMQLAER
jgi:hypothetical protein